MRNKILFNATRFDNFILLPNHYIYINKVQSIQHIIYICIKKLISNVVTATGESETTRLYAHIIYYTYAEVY